MHIHLFRLLSLLLSPQRIDIAMTQHTLLYIESLKSSLAGIK